MNITNKEFLENNGFKLQYSSDELYIFIKNSKCVSIEVSFFDKSKFRVIVSSVSPDSNKLSCLKDIIIKGSPNANSEIKTSDLNFGIITCINELLLQIMAHGTNLNNELKNYIHPLNS